MLGAYRCLENFHLARLVFVFPWLVDVNQNGVGAVLNLDIANAGHGQRGAHQAFKAFGIADQQSGLGGRCQLVGDELAGVVEFLTQILNPHEREEPDQQDGQQQGRAETDHLRAGVNVPVTKRHRQPRSAAACS